MGLAFLITTDKLHILSERKVLKQHEYAALLDATSILGTAQEERERLLKDAEAHREQQLKAGYDAGYEKGEREAATRLYADALANARALAAMKQLMAELVTRTVRELAADLPRDAIYAKAFSRIETLVEHEPVLTVRIAPQQVADLERVLGTMTDGTRRVRVVPDASLSEEALVVETASGVVEAGIDTQLAALHAALVGDEA
ncbi:Yop proteins translocation protein L [Ralstonia edaphis]|jgi:type III secretion protein L|uniref:Type 3 secretion system stator protein n=1 Tax=Ralstonia edaphi TaxID=3058599 RepID=A0AB72WZZ5_9RALS|nr:type III secretion system stator protein SctL [Ralstonia sp. LMG 6871]CAJ0706242.1 Yop proteins translocation protein L [Ralstonia sp. LMG 6871]CAJ0720403.1 Yop proteins translocation protein L [Ralstonia sp. LMG 6871]CAJ0736109.1 Yop proteins translocation protein L [Ralstonia sp. LMG 6871]